MLRRSTHPWIFLVVVGALAGCGGAPSSTASASAETSGTVAVAPVTATASATAAPASSTPSAAPQPVSVAVTACPTTYGYQPPASTPVPTPVESIQTASESGGISGYSNSKDLALAPQGWKCAGLIAVDGGGGVWASSGTQRLVMVSNEAACVSCIYGDVCRFYPTYVGGESAIPCGSTPAGETVVKKTATLVIYIDPPGSWQALPNQPQDFTGSGEQLIGLVVITSSTTRTPDVTAQCVMPSDARQLCVDLLNQIAAANASLLSP